MLGDGAAHETAQGTGFNLSGEGHPEKRFGVDLQRGELGHGAVAHGRQGFDLAHGGGHRDHGGVGQLLEQFFNVGAPGGFGDGPVAVGLHRGQGPPFVSGDAHEIFVDAGDLGGVVAGREAEDGAAIDAGAGPHFSHGA